MRISSSDLRSIIREEVVRSLTEDDKEVVNDKETGDYIDARDPAHITGQATIKVKPLTPAEEQKRKEELAVIEAKLEKILSKADLEKIQAIFDSEDEKVKESHYRRANR